MINQSDLKKRLHYEPGTGVFTRLDSRIPSATSRWGGKPAGYITHNGYVMISIDGKKTQAHRLAFLYMTGTMPIDDIDHINGDRADNKWSNLRETTRQRNLQNQRRASKNNILGILGVSPKRSKYVARIMVDKQVVRLGTFETSDAAHAAYISAKRRLHEGNTL